jgi:peptidoglycan/LPS O-acetylase OafA/YrhL
MESNSAAPGRLVWMDGLRGIAAGFVVIQHYFWPLLHEPGENFFDPGVFGVGVFFLISGYIIPISVRPAKGIPTRRFFFSRIFRLYPAYWISLVLGVIVYHPSLRTLGLNITMGQRFLGAGDVIGVYWTLQIELLFYVFVACTLLAGHFNRPKVVVSAALVAALGAVALAAVRFWLHKKTPIAVPIGLTFIFVGNLFSLVREGTLARSLLVKVLCGVLPLMVVTFVLGYSRDWGFGETPQRFIISYSVALGLFVLASTLNWKLGPMVWVGLLSYPLYLLHQPIRAGLLKVLPAWPAVATMALALALALLGAELIHRFVEAPAIRLGRRVAEGRRTGDDAVVPAAAPQG